MGVPRSFATVAIDTFITDESRVIRNCAPLSRSSTSPVLAPTGFEGEVMRNIIGTSKAPVRKDFPVMAEAASSLFPCRPDSLRG